ncbi:ABC transporter ATP-binding protein [Anopheles sinensis]|uniref:ABC transporter ATP-binding protein n=1 Tax=Anopheles sinensis TaxID=74873 RepID=A0A084WBK6_ANOSI|nr:ABC transporter ATP-binding protein [Anopheles sinensis]
MAFTAIATVTRVLSMFVLFSCCQGLCEVEDYPQQKATDSICRNQTDSVELYPIAFHPPPLSGVDEHYLFRTGGIAYGCLKFVMHCGTPNFELRCQSVSAIYNTQPPLIPYGALDITFTAMSTPTYSVERNESCENNLSNRFYIIGHVSRFVFIRFCVNVVSTKTTISGYWLFVSYDNTQQDNEQIVHDIAKKYTSIKMPNIAGTPLQSWWIPKKRCNCELYRETLQRITECNPAMFEKSKTLLQKMLENNESDRLLKYKLLLGIFPIIEPWYIMLPVQLFLVATGAFSFCIVAASQNSPQVF